MKNRMESEESEEIKEVKKYFKKLDKLLEEKDIKGIVGLAKENGWNKNYSEEVYIIAMHKLIIARRIGSLENQGNSYDWLLENGFNPEGIKPKPL